jgi:hypothetical protein
MRDGFIGFPDREELVFLLRPLRALPFFLFPSPARVRCGKGKPSLLQKDLPVYTGQP